MSTNVVYYPSGFVWSSFTGASADLILANTTFNTTFTQTSAVNWKWSNITPATLGTPQNSPGLIVAGTYWTGAVSAPDSWTIQDVVGVGSHGTSTLAITHAGSSGVSIVSVPILESQSGSPLAISGFMRMSNIDYLSWRINDNSADAILLQSGPINGNVPADALVYAGNGSGILAPCFGKNGTLIAKTGIFRLANIDSVGWRNFANGGDLLLGVNTSDELTWAGSALIGTIIEGVTHTPSSSGDTGQSGQFAWDQNYFYIATSNNTWKRVAISTW
jgi:hypothetical protein